MKKLIFSIAAVAVMGSMAYVTLGSNNHDRELSALELSNIEALTNGEAVEGGYLVVTRREFTGIGLECTCGGIGPNLCCDHPDFPGWN